MIGILGTVPLADRFEQRDARRHRDVQRRAEPEPRPGGRGELERAVTQQLRVPVRLLSPLAANLEAAYGRTIPAENRALQLLVAADLHVGGCPALGPGGRAVTGAPLVMDLGWTAR
mgnify:CR=1 FL=1